MTRRESRAVAGQAIVMTLETDYIGAWRRWFRAEGHHHHGQGHCNGKWRMRSMQSPDCGQLVTGDVIAMGARQRERAKSAWSEEWEHAEGKGRNVPWGGGWATVGSSQRTPLQ
jgi:hypothetical protein